MQIQVGNSPFNQEQVELINQLLATLTDSQKIWLSGFFSGSLSRDSETTALSNKEQPTMTVKDEITILYGSQTGNAQGLSKKAQEELEKNGFKVTVAAMNDFKPNQLKKINQLLIIVSTHGEGDPPDNAIIFHEFLYGKRAPKLEHLHYSVLALGDSSYEFFCQVGKEFDRKLEELGATRIYPRFDCDLDFDEPAQEWLEGVIKSLKEANPDGEPQALKHLSTSQTVSAYSRSNPFKAEVLENLNLNGKGSNKETRHLELSLEGSGLTYKPGDSLGIIPENDPALVDSLLNVLKWGADESVIINKQGDILSLKEALTRHYEITVITKPLLQKVQELLQHPNLDKLLETSNETTFRDYIEGRDLLDLIEDFGIWGDSAQEFVSVLRKIPPRLYSIASSYEANPDEVHLTIGTVRYSAHGKNRKGVCSTFCAERISIGDKIPVFIQSNDNFRLPDDPSTPIIMVGPGTGVAPFRAFMQEREETGATGKSWMFFGDQHFMTDFLYQTEWNQWLNNEVLTKMSVAFSRDGADKIYVQHRMKEHSKELYSWLEEGAVLYICGDEKNMAKDVHETLIEIIAKEGNVSRAIAEEYLSNLQQLRRYQRDVY
ncbi:assimilatory sulfite reductase (NADPH) flavoprotein subunit [Robertmurraya sp. DFI.2.37]|uniref:assimilatory sulfite reductase (NADPH) flavoprotein subunit n=1 Tax=Robertmurraya sp. DFI.2.37 TaxID=3031819 RepID=UPI001246D860|nr:assimilatory sulfite reductase (NADPH) flavoprotein subunit [Robertmurraya sp. DFI.2.37]MDF1508528.1 assimilatory sulfite reductase (NADPH) flavoprotein subunit [Robertmurraya sp. DFI.2.37]